MPALRAVQSQAAHGCSNRRTERPEQAPLFDVNSQYMTDRRMKWQEAKASVVERDVLMEEARA